MRFGPSGGGTVLGNFAGEVGDIVQAMPCDMCQVGEVEIGGIMCSCNFACQHNSSNVKVGAG